MSYTRDNRYLGNTIQPSDQAIDVFKSEGFMRTNRFEILINSPTSMSSATKQVQFHIKEIYLVIF